MEMRPGLWVRCGVGRRSCSCVCVEVSAWDLPTRLTCSGRLCCAVLYVCRTVRTRELLALQVDGSKIVLVVACTKLPRADWLVIGNQSSGMIKGHSTGLVRVRLADAERVALRCRPRHRRKSVL